jgi:ribosomal protein L16/L10AE
MKGLKKSLAGGSSSEGLKRVYVSVPRCGRVLFKKSFLKSTFSSSVFLRKKYILFAQEYGQLSDCELEAARRVLRRLLSRKRDRVQNCVSASTPLTRKPAQSRMGRGKGSFSGLYVCNVCPGQRLFEIETHKSTPVAFLRFVSERAVRKLSISVKHGYLKSLLSF